MIVCGFFAFCHVKGLMVKYPKKMLHYTIYSTGYHGNNPKWPPNTLKKSLYNFLSVGNKLILFLASNCYTNYLYYYFRICVCHTYNNVNDFVFKCAPNNQGCYHSNTHNTTSFTCIYPNPSVKMKINTQTMKALPLLKAKS